MSGWLHCTARNLAAKFVRAEMRLRACEQEAATMNLLLSAESEVPWEFMAPHLDAALGMGRMRGSIGWGEGARFPMQLI